MSDAILYVPRVSGFTFQDDNPPNWFEDNPQAPKDPRWDEPRWNGAASIDLIWGAKLCAQFKALHVERDWRGRKSLFFSWRVLDDPLLESSTDCIYVGFGSQDEKKYFVVRIKAFDLRAGDRDGEIETCQPEYAFDIDVAFVDPGNGGLMGGGYLEAKPLWLDFVRVWLNKRPGAENSKSTILVWAVNMYVPVDESAGANFFSKDGLNISNKFKFFFDVHTRNDLIPSLCSLNWPRNALDVVDWDQKYPKPETWGELELLSGQSVDKGGVFVRTQSDDIGNMIDHGAPGNQIGYRAGAGQPQPLNTLYVNIDNRTEGKIDPHDIKATFKISNWGSSPTWSIASDESSWEEVPGGQIENEESIEMGRYAVVAGHPPPLHFDWRMTRDEYLPYVLGTKSDHQCILVKLELTEKAIKEGKEKKIRFVNDSAWRNHRIVSASEAVQHAEINIGGLAPLPRSKGWRDLYLVVKTHNMPAPRAIEEFALMEETAVALDRSRFLHTVWNQTKIKRLQGRGVHPEAIDVLATHGLRAALATGKVDLDSLMDMQPIYNVSVFYDTGKKSLVDGMNYSVLGEMPSFGLLPDHVGQLVGWEHALEFSLGTIHRELAPGLWHLRLPEGGKTHVSLRVKAVEFGDLRLNLPWWVWFLPPPLLWYILLLQNH